MCLGARRCRFYWCCCHGVRSKATPLPRLPAASCVRGKVILSTADGVCAQSPNAPVIDRFCDPGQAPAHRSQVVRRSTRRRCHTHRAYCNSQRCELPPQILLRHQCLASLGYALCTPSNRTSAESAHRIARSGRRRPKSGPFSLCSWGAKAEQRDLCRRLHFLFVSR